MSDGGKGSKPRPYSVSQEEFANNWEAIFAKNEKRRQKIENDFQDILATEDCVIDALKEEKK
jgi:hypothetical protein